MNRIKLMLCCMLISISLVGCGETTNETEESYIEYEKKYGRIKELHLDNDCSILVDVETRVQYLYTHWGYSGGLSVMLDAEGKPLLYEGEVE